jgi:hypothetical protein
MNEKLVYRQGIPLLLTGVVCALLVGAVWLEVILLNAVSDAHIALRVRFADVLIGLTIYLKTSIDFAIFMGRLMRSYPGWKNRIAIEIGTAFGNAAGTILILAVWALFKEVTFLLAAMTLIAAVVLFRLAEVGLDLEDLREYPAWFQWFARTFKRTLALANKYTAPILDRIIPNVEARAHTGRRFIPLFLFSITIPFLLGLDDFAGYIPIFSVVNVLGFSIGAFLGHMFLNIFLYINPDVTIRVVKNAVIATLGSVAFVLIGLWGIVETIHIIFGI